MSAHLAGFSTEVRRRLDDLDQEVRAGGLDPAIDLIVSSLRRGGVLQAFGTGHSQAFAMEIAGRAGGLIPTHAIVLRDVVLRGSRDVSALQGATLERDESVVDELYELYSFDPADVFLIASNSGVNASMGILSAVSGEWRTWRGGRLDGRIERLGPGPTSEETAED